MRIIVIATGAARLHPRYRRARWRESHTRRRTRARKEAGGGDEQTATQRAWRRRPRRGPRARAPARRRRRANSRPTQPEVRLPAAATRQRSPDVWEFTPEADRARRRRRERARVPHEQQRHQAPFAPPPDSAAHTGPEFERPRARRRRPSPRAQRLHLHTFIALGRIRRHHPDPRFSVCAERAGPDFFARVAGRRRATYDAELLGEERSLFLRSFFFPSTARGGPPPAIESPPWPCVEGTRACFWHVLEQEHRQGPAAHNTAMMGRRRARSCKPRIAARHLCVQGSA